MMLQRVIFWIKKLRHVNILKSLYYSYKFKGKIICGNCRMHIHGGGRICLTNNATLYIGVDYSYPVPAVLDLHQGVLSIKGNVSINRGCKVVIGKNATLEIGNGSFINEGSKIYCNKSIKVGEKCAIGFDVKLLDTDIHKIFDKNEQINNNKDIFIGNKVWIGANSLVLKGSIIDDNTIIGANSIVKCKCNGNHIYAGNPLKELSEFDQWKL